MKNSNIDELYINIDKHILLAQAYMEIPELYFIIKACRLKPYQYVFEGLHKLVLFEKWFDEFGNTLNIVNKEIDIKYNDLSMDRNKIICTDLYYGLSLNKIVKMSKFVYICAGIDEDKFKDTFFLTFIGLDNFFRSYLYLYGEWQKVSPLLLGMKGLIKLVDSMESKRFKRLSFFKKFPMHCVSGQAYLTCLPAGEELMKILTKKHEKLIDEIF
jgi:hypothetical protein